MRYAVIDVQDRGDGSPPVLLGSLTAEQALAYAEECEGSGLARKGPGKGIIVLSDDGLLLAIPEGLPEWVPDFGEE